MKNFIALKLVGFKKMSLILWRDMEGGSCEKKGASSISELCWIVEASLGLDDKWFWQVLRIKFSRLMVRYSIEIIHKVKILYMRKEDTIFQR